MISSIISYGIPILLAAIGGYMTDISGKLNIALEGLILLGAFSAYLVMFTTSSYLITFIVSALVPAVIAALFASLTTRLRGNIFITGLAMNLLIPGFIALLSNKFFATSGVLHLQSASYFSFNTLVWIFSLLIVLIYISSYIILYQTKAGLTLRASGLNQRALQIRGGDPDRIQILAFGFSGLLCGLSGTFLTLTIHAFVPNISSGKGWLALAAIYLGDRKLSGLIYATIFFSAAEMTANFAQGQFDLPASLFLGFPYLITFLGLIVRSQIIRNRDH